MSSLSQGAQDSKKMLWTGRVIKGLVLLFLLFDGITKVMKMALSVEGTVRIGYPANLVMGIGIVLLACTALYAIPRTSIFGAILLTGYLGGATASQLRIGAPLFSNVLFPVYFGVLVWAGIYLSESRLRALIPLQH